MTDLTPTPRTSSPSACGPSGGRASTCSAARSVRRWTRRTPSTASPTSVPTASPSTTTTSSRSTPTPAEKEAAARLAATRPGRDRPRRADGHHQPVLPPGLPRRRLHQQRPRRAPLRAPQGGRQHRPRGVARGRGLRRLGRTRRRRVGSEQGRPGRARPLRRGVQRARAPTSLEQGYDIRFAIEPKPNEPRGDILLPDRRQRARLHQRAGPPRAGRGQPRGRARGDGRAQLLPQPRPGAVARQALPRRPQRAARPSLRPGPPVRCRQRARRLLDRRHPRVGRLRRTPSLRLQASAHRGRRRCLGLRRRLHPELPDPAGEVAGVPGRPRGAGGAPRRPGRPARPSRPSRQGESLADLRAESFDPEAAAARGMAFEALDQLALEHLYGVRG